MMVLQIWRGIWLFVPNLQIMQQNVNVLKLFSIMSLFLKLNFNKIELQVELDISNIEFYVYFIISIFLKI